MQSDVTPPEEKRILLFLAEGFEDYEAVTLLSLCGWGEYRPHLSKLTVVICGLHAEVRGRFGLSLATDLLLSEVNPKDYDALAVPGGFHDRGFDEAYCTDLHNVARAMHENGAILATFCVGVLPLAQAGLLIGGKATTYAFSRSHDNFGYLEKYGCEGVREPVVEWNRIISCSGPAFSVEVVTLLLNDLIGAEPTAEIFKYRQGIEQ